MGIDLDYMEYSSNALAQAAYVTNSATYLQSYSEATIKTQGSYSLKAIAAITNSLSKTLTRTLATSYNLTSVKNLRFDIRASRTGSNIKLELYTNPGTGGTISTEGANTVHTFITDGTFTPPACFTGNVQVECWGGGGGGGGSNAASYSGGGGGGGAYVITPTVAVVGGTGYAVVAGTGGDAPAGAAGRDGEASSFGGTTVVAGGGGHGGRGDVAGGHAGAGATTGTGTTKYNGGSGLAGTSGTASVGGGGGGSGGTASNGTTATTQTGATAVTGGGNGGNGGAIHAVGVTPTTPPGGGGGGSGHYTSSNLSGGVGANGKVVVKYLTTPTAITITPNIVAANVFQPVKWDISAISNADKSYIEKIIITITNATAANTFYIDNFVIAQSIDLFGWSG